MSLFSRGTLRPIAVVTIACFSLLTTGCYNYVQIPPSEAEKLNATETARSVPGNPDVQVKSRVNVEREDGRLYEVLGAADLIVRTEDGRELMFKHPLSVEANMVRFTVASKNRASTRIETDDIEEVVVKDRSPARSALLAMGVAVGVIGVSSGIAVAAVR
jgi:hypothetical protein